MGRKKGIKQVIVKVDKAISDACSYRHYNSRNWNLYTKVVLPFYHNVLNPNYQWRISLFNGYDIRGKWFRETYGRNFGGNMI